MSSIAKTLVATGCSSGIGFEVIKQLLTQSQPWNFILGARDVPKARQDFASLAYDKSKHNLTLFPLDLSKVKNAGTFASQTLNKLGDTGKIDYLLLNAAVNKTPDAGFHPKWSEQYVVNHLSQHYLMHLLAPKLIASKSRVIFVSSGAVRMVSDPSTLTEATRDGASTSPMDLYCATKFQQLLGAHWWRRELAGKVTVVAVSPGMVPGTGIGRHLPPYKIPEGMLKDAISVPQSGEAVLRAFTRDDLPEDPQRIFLASWGEWWDSDVYKLSLDKELQDQWSPSKEEIEKEEGIST